MRVPVIFLLTCLAAAGAGLDGFDAFVEQALKDWKVPGVAVAIVQDGKVILSRGYGLRDVANNQPVTANTLFAIGSSSKSFTVCSLGVLVDQGKLDWDKPVREYLPDFRLYEESASDRITPRDLVTHRSGLPRHDLVWYNSPLSRKEIFSRLRFLEPSADLRSTWQYQNLMYLTAGYLAGQIADTTWENHVRETIFKPLGMNSSNFSVADSQKSADHALPYTTVKETIKQIPFRNIDQVGPAGSINSNVADMANYVMMHLNKGKHGSRQVIGAANAAQMQTPQMVVPGPLIHRELGHTSYGMGFFITTYRGHKLVHHGGNIDGFSALVTFMPQANIGMVILTNSSGSPLPGVISYNVYDRLMNLDQVEWTARFKADREKARASEEEAKKKGYTAKRAGTQPSHDLAEYAGDYEHPGYGEAKVEHVDGKLRFTFNRLSGDMNHFHYDVFEVAEKEGEVNPLAKLKVRFHSNLQGDIESFSVPLESTVKEISFALQGDRRMREKSFLAPLSGVYQRGPAAVTIALKGDNALALTIAGQPTYELVPVRGTKFNVKGLTGVSVEFKGDELIFFQPNGTFVAKKQP